MPPVPPMPPPAMTGPVSESRRTWIEPLPLLPEAKRTVRRLGTPVPKLTLESLK